MFDWLARKEHVDIEWASAKDTEKIPYGFFRVLWPNGKCTRGLRHAAYGECWETPDSYLAKLGVVPPTVEVLATCPLVRRAIAAIAAKGETKLPGGSRMQQVGDQGGNLPGESSDAVEWDDASSGISGKEHARRADINNGLW